MDGSTTLDQETAVYFLPKKLIIDSIRIYNKHMPKSERMKHNLNERDIVKYKLKTQAKYK